jgi:tripartite-type tricarboxylate transporter receptor subunit TctC
LFLALVRETPVSRAPCRLGEGTARLFVKNSIVSSRRAVRLALSCAVLFCALGASAFAQDFASGKTVRMIVPSSAGGVTDTGARLIARYLGRHLQGKPSIVVENMPGANGFSAANDFYNNVQPDGLTIFAGSSSQVMPDIVRNNPSVRFDVAKEPLFGAVQYGGTLLIGAANALPRLTDRSKPPVVMAAVGEARTGAMIPVWGAAYLGWNLSWVTGYEGTPQLVLALLKGEADMMNTTGTAGIGPLLKAPDRFKVVAQTGVVKDGRLVRRDSFPNVPTIGELVDAKLGNNRPHAFDSWLETIKLGKYFALPPKTPARFVEIYRKAFAEMANDPEFKAQAENILEPGYVLLPPDAAADIVAKLEATPDADLVAQQNLLLKYGSSKVGGPALAK